MKFQVEEKVFRSCRLGVNSRELRREWKQKTVVPKDEQARMFCSAFRNEEFRTEGTVRRCFFIGRPKRRAGNRAHEDETGRMVYGWCQQFLTLLWVEELACTIAVLGEFVDWNGPWGSTPSTAIPWHEGERRRIRVLVREDYLEALDMPVVTSPYAHLVPDEEERRRSIPSLKEALECAM